jgi:membrane protease YdiL (CAAX protease family)
MFGAAYHVRYDSVATKLRHIHWRVKQMASGHNNEGWQPDALLPALVIVGPYFFNKLIYIYFSDYAVFVATDYACRTFSLALLYLLLRKPTVLPIPWRLAAPSAKELLMALAGTIVLIGSNVVGMTLIRYLDTHSWRVTRFPLPTNSLLQYFDSTVGMVFVGLSEEAVFRFYLINLLLLRGISPTMAIVFSTMIFGGIHWSYGAGATIFAMLAGFVLSIIFVAARNLTAPIIVHAAFDAFFFAGGIDSLWRIYDRAW